LLSTLTEKEIKVISLRKKGLTQTDVAKRLKISQAAVCKFEKNAKAKIAGAKETIRIASELGVEGDA